VLYGPHNTQPQFREDDPKKFATWALRGYTDWQVEEYYTAGNAAVSSYEVPSRRQNY